MNWLMVLVLSLSLMTVVFGLILYGYWLAIQHVKQERQRRLVAIRTTKDKNAIDRMDFDIFDVFDVD